MILHVREVKYLHDYVLGLRFYNGAEGEVDLADELDGEIFEPLKNISKFKKVKVDLDIQTLVWENAADIAPEFLYDKMKVLA
jgi:hypothetical protein